MLSIIIIIVVVIGTLVFLYLDGIMNQEQKHNLPYLISPYNKSLKVEMVAKGLSSPTSMAFVGSKNKNNKDILVLEKKGTVRLISAENGSLKEEPVLKLNVDARGERGLLGIATLNDDTVFLYYTQADPLRNKIYKYQWDGERLINPVLVLDLPTEPGPYHQGGKLKIDPHNKFLFAVIGDLIAPNTKLQNNKYGKQSNDTSIIFRINVDKVSLSGKYYNNALSSNNTRDIEKEAFNNNNYYYYSYGIRNSFGLAIDPLTGNLWDTENGEDKYDEINIARPGFNSGWIQIMGPISRNNKSTIQSDLVNFPGYHYSDPVFSWKFPIGITDIEFLNSSSLGKKYRNNIFVGDINNGNIYYFEINSSRTGIKFDPVLTSSGLTDLVADNNNETMAVTFGTNFGRITDIETGIDGFLYVLSYEDGKIFRIKGSM
jgi:glucose/arabinose dehydrogenase